jgi:hypothetical protein
MGCNEGTRERFPAKSGGQGRWFVATAVDGDRAVLALGFLVDDQPPPHDSGRRRGLDYAQR